MVYININSYGEKETIDEFETRKEGLKMLREYQLAYQGSGIDLWLSQRACKDWND